MLHNCKLEFVTFLTSYSLLKIRKSFWKISILKAFSKTVFITKQKKQETPGRYHQVSNFLSKKIAEADQQSKSHIRFKLIYFRSLAEERDSYFSKLKDIEDELRIIEEQTHNSSLFFGMTSQKFCQRLNKILVSESCECQRECQCHQTCKCQQKCQCH